MSLYEGLNVDLGDKDASKGKGWSSAGLKLLHSQIQLKKAALTQRDRAKAPASSGASAVTTVVDLSSRSAGTKRPAADTKPPVESILKPRKALVLDGPPLSFIPKLGKDEKVLIFGEIVVEDEYNPMMPNDYEAAVERRENEKKRERDDERNKDAHERERKRMERVEKEEKMEEEKEREKRSAGAAIAPPPMLIEEDQKVLEEPTAQSSFTPDFGSGSKGLGVAARIMEKYGYKQGLGLGRQGQGISKALSVQKTSVRGGRIINEKHDAVDDEAEDASEMPPPPVPVAAPAPEVEPTPITELLKNPTKLVLLRNMVSPGDVDEDLEPEVKEEMAKYGDVLKCLIYEMPPPAIESEAVRIFLEFAKIDQAIKAVVDLNGRYFGGRNVRASFYDLDKFRRLDLTGD